MPFGRDTLVVSSSVVLDRSLGPPTEREDLGVGTPSLQRCRQSPNYFGPCLSTVQKKANKRCI